MDKAEPAAAQQTEHAKQWHWKEYGAELIGTFLLVFVGLSAVVFDFGHGLPMSHWLPDRGWRLLLTGLLFAGTGSLIAISPLGRLSGAHINPAVSFAFWLHGKMHRQDLFSYAVSQFIGATLGATLLAFVWGHYAQSVNFGMTDPGQGYTVWQAFVAEFLLTGSYIFTIFIFVSSATLMRWTPMMNWLVVATMVWLEAPISGTSLNPARSAGPALISFDWHHQWIYATAPLLGALVAAGLFQILTPADRKILTAKLFHDSRYPNIFRNLPHLLHHNPKEPAAQPD